MRFITEFDQPHEVDYIVVGAGASGCVVASQLLRKGLGTVLLLEAGGWPASKQVKVPVLYPQAFGTSLDWNYRSIPQSNANGRTIALPSGKVLGGSTAINAMIYLRGHPTDFADWRTRCGDTWDWSSVVPDYEAVEQVLAPNVPVASLHPVTQRLLEIARERGLAADPAQAGRLTPRIGLDAYHRTQRNGRRFGAWQAFMLPWINGAGKRPGTLHIRSDAQVQRVVLKDGKAVAIELMGGECIPAKRGVILCAGAIQSPALLMQSGIGPRDDLRAAGRDCWMDNEHVGAHLADHLIFPLVYSLREHASLPNRFDPAARAQYAQSRTGPMASNIAELGGFFVPHPSAPSTPDRHPPQVYQCHITPTHYLAYPSRDTCGLSFGVTLCRSNSRGRIRLDPDGPTGSLSIDMQYLSESSEREAWIKAIEWTRGMVREHFDRVAGEELLPGAKRSQPEQLASALARFATTLYHYAGTCRMGGPQDGVVDSEFRVYGTEGLWVCDASVFPTMMSANTQATAMMLGWRLGDSLTQRDYR